ncbi:MAG: amino acid permease [Lachnospiraceae bacterium]|nr:amino acid permease [Lachnospiraceae bacterium]
MKERMNERVGYISAWAYAFACACGWGGFVMPGNIFLPEAGPLGSAIGIVLAGVTVFFIGISISYMAKRFPTDAGVHVYVGKILGRDHGFLAAWAMLLAYLSIMWGNATASVLLLRYVWGDLLQWGFHYQVAGYDVYFGEVLLTISIIVIAGLLAIFGRMVVRVLHVLLALMHIALVIILFFGVLILGHKTAPGSFGFADYGVPNGLEVFSITMLAPWMFEGFESVTYMLNSGGRKVKHLDCIVTISVIAGFLNYFMLTLIPALALPEGFATWSDYLAASSVSDGLFKLPVFYSVYTTMGVTGLNLLVLCIICAIFTSLFGLYRVTGRLLVTMSEEELMPKVIGRKNRIGEPGVAILLIMILSAIIPIFGRTAIGWIVDVTTISATIVYVYCTIGSFKLAIDTHDSDKRICMISVIGMIASLCSIVFLLLPNFFAESKLATESYFILAIWSMSGMIYYWYVYKNDKNRLYGQSTVMWMVNLFFIFFSTVMWIRQRSIDQGGALPEEQKNILVRYVTANAVIQMAVVFVVLAIMFSLFTTMLSRQRETDKKALESEARNQAKTSFLFNMSHDIRTPMNAIMGFTDLALSDTTDPEKMDDYLRKIKSSGAHLLALINDVLEMSRIESGKIELSRQVVNLEEFLSGLDSIMRGQADAKQQTFVISESGLKHPYVITDRLRLSQVLLNLASNAVKYTPQKGKVEISLEESPGPGDASLYTFRVKDNGMGMTSEFAAKVFEAFERDKKAEEKGIQGTGLGMAITKRILDIMEGEITVTSEPDKGSEFTVRLRLPYATEEEIKTFEEENAPKDVDFSGKRVLLADDVDINREIAVAILEMMGLAVEEAQDGAEAVEKVLQKPAGYYDAVLMDIQMPRMNGYEATRAIRESSDPLRAEVPIIAMTANAFEEDVKNALEAGMNGHVAKPIDQEQLVRELGAAFEKKRVR